MSTYFILTLLLKIADWSKNQGVTLMSWSDPTSIASIQIEIAIGIEIVLAVALDRLIISNLITPSTQATWSIKRW